MLLVIHENSAYHLLSQLSLSKKQPKCITLSAAMCLALLFLGCTTKVESCYCPLCFFLKSDSSPVGALKPHQLQMFPKLNSFTVCITLQVQSTVKGGKYIGNYIPPI